MINNSKSLAFLAMVVLLMAVATARYNPNSLQQKKEETKKGLLSAAAGAPGVLKGQGTTGSNPNGSLKSRLVNLSGKTNPFTGSGNIGPIRGKATGKKPMNGCLKGPGFEGCAKSGKPMKGKLKTAAGTTYVNVKGPIEPKLPIERVKLP